MKKILFLLSVVMITMTSCLKHDLDELESSKLCDISNVEFEYRWTEEIIGSNGSPTGVHELHYKGIEVTRTKDEANHKISLEMKVPMPSGDFTLERRQQVSLQNLYVYCFYRCQRNSIERCAGFRKKRRFLSEKLCLPCDGSFGRLYRLGD